MEHGHMPIGRRERAKQDKRERIMAAARELLAQHGGSGVTTQQIADRADVAIGTLYLYASTKAELLIMVQNENFAAAIDEGVLTRDESVDAAAAAFAGAGDHRGHPRQHQRHHVSALQRCGRPCRHPGPDRCRPCGPSSHRPTAHLARGAVRLVGAALDASSGIDYDSTQL